MQMELTVHIAVESYTPEIFDPFVQLIAAPEEPGRLPLAAMNDGEQSGATLKFWCSHVAPGADLPLSARRMERHVHSAQAFVPLTPIRWLVLVAPHTADSRPDMAAARAFVPPRGTGVIYRRNVWHHPVTVFGDAARFAVLQWCFSDERDVEFVDVQPSEVRQP
jgi:ureidoglycolate lyase